MPNMVSSGFIEEKVVYQFHCCMAKETCGCWWPVASLLNYIVKGEEFVVPSKPVKQNDFPNVGILPKDRSHRAPNSTVIQEMVKGPIPLKGPHFGFCEIIRDASQGISKM